MNQPIELFVPEIPW